MSEISEMVPLATTLEAKDKEALAELAKRNGRKPATEARLAIKTHLDAEERPTDLRGAA